MEWSAVTNSKFCNSDNQCFYYVLYALKCFFFKYEQCSSVHSFIFDPTDDCWEDRLTKKEIEDISKEGNVGLPSLDQSIHDIFNTSP